jgi:hypothetical protein
MTAYTDEAAEMRKESKKERARQRATQYQRDTAVNNLYKTTEGRAYLWWILELSQAIGINPFSHDTHTTAFQCGQMNVGQQLMSHMINTNPDAFAELMKEQTYVRPNRSSHGDTGSDGDSGSGSDTSGDTLYE